MLTKSVLLLLATALQFQSLVGCDDGPDIPAPQGCDGMVGDACPAALCEEPDGTIYNFVKIIEEADGSCRCALPEDCPPPDVPYEGGAGPGVGGGGVGGAGGG